MTVTLAQIKKDQLKARKGSAPTDKICAKLLTTLLGEIENNQKKDPKFNIENLIKKFIKDIDTTLEVSFGDNFELIFERNFLSMYLPVQLTEDDLRGILSVWVMDQTEFGEEVSMKTAMKHLTSNYKNQYNGKIASKLVKEMLL